VGVSEYIQEYGINDEKGLIEIAKLAAQQLAWLGGVSKYIQAYGIKDEQVRIEIAKLAAQQSGEGVSRYIKNYGIKADTVEGQKTLIEIAKLAAQQSGGGVSLYIQAYGIKDEKVLIEIAKLAAQQSGEGVSRNIQEYGIKADTVEGQKALIEIAKLAAQQSGEGVSQYIRDYGIKDEQGLIEIAKLAAQQSGKETSAFIQNYGIKDEKALIEIAKLAARQNVLGTAANIEYYHIDADTPAGNEALFSIFLSALEQDEGSSEWSTHYQLPQLETPLWKAAIQSLINNEGAASTEVLFQCVSKYLSEKGGGKALTPFLESIKKESNPLWQHNMAVWLMATLGRLELKQMNASQVEKVAPFLGKILQHRSPKQRMEMSRLLIDRLGGDEKTLSHIASLTKTCPHMQLPALFLYSLAAEGADRERCEGLYAKSVISKQKLFEDRKRMLQLTNTLSSVLAETKLTPEDKLFLLETAFKADEKELLQNLTAIQGILRFGAADTLTKKPLEAHANFSQVFQGVFSRFVPQSELMSSDLFTQKYEERLGKFRNPMALATYAGGLNQLPLGDQQSTTALLGKYVSSVLTGDFPKIRYDRTTSPHLTQLFDGHDDLKKNWMQGAAVSLESLLSEKAQSTPASAAPRIDVVGYLRTKLITDKHLGDLRTSYPYLWEYLTFDEVGRTASMAKLDEAMRGTSKGKEGKEQKQVLAFQRACIALCKAPDPQQAIKAVQPALKKISGELVAFRQDVEALEKQLSTKETKAIGEKRYEGWLCVDTDDAEDMLVVASETEGCQSVDGDPNLNKCLLAYMMDGKNRLIAVKKPGGALAARSILRMLWDPKEEKPVLLMERIYPSNTSDQFREVLMKMALGRARALGLDLVSKEVGEGDSYPGTIESLGGPAPYEYCDASNGVNPESRFKVDSTHRIQRIGV